MLAQENSLNWCNMLCFAVYFAEVLCGKVHKYLYLFDIKLMIGSALAKNVSTAGYASEKMKVVKLTDLHQFSFFQTHSIVLQYVS